MAKKKSLHEKLGIPTLEELEKQQKKLRPRKSPVKSDDGSTQTAYGFEFAGHLSDLQIEIVMFRENPPESEGGMGRLFHYQNICEILWPDTRLSRWGQRLQEAFCRRPKREGTPLHMVITGPASAGKSWEAARFAIVWMLMAPTEFAVPVTSTSVQMSKKRVWAKLKTLWREADANCYAKYGHHIHGHILDSSCELQGTKGDSEHAIAIVPGSQKYAVDSVAKLKGWHAKYVLVLADELQDMTKEVIDSCPNMQAGTKEFIFIGLGNGQSWMNTLGEQMMPISGSPESVCVDDAEWETKSGFCIHFDGLDSPNIEEPGMWPWHQSQQQIDQVIEKHGENSLQYWQMVRGFPPPDDSFAAIVSESLLIKFQAMNQQELVPGWEWHAGLDPAFGGDGCILKFAKVGVFIHDPHEMPKIGVVAEDKIHIKTEASKTEPIDFQIANQVIEACKQRGVRPRNFSVDCTAIGRGVAAIIRQNWSNEIHCVEFGGNASDLPVSNLDMTKGVEAYWNRVTELYYSLKTFVMNSQIRGITPQMARGYGCRTYDTKNGRSVLSSKLEARKSLGRSPDEEDAFVTIIDNLRHQGLQGGTLGFDKQWNDAVTHASSLEAEYGATDVMLMN